ncbi:MAG: hypothetical protein HOP16_11620 [Acidobacteria bacterium]|nr:hypothetical protein [Acidobacteriota bacterium]
MLRATVLGLMLSLVLATRVEAQLASPAPPGPYAIDARGAISGLPVDAGFYPSAPTGTNVPGRGPGIDVGGHVYPWQLGIARLGIGATLLRTRGSASAAVASSGSQSTDTVTPDASMTLTVLAPQLSFNFGTSAGWSYLSAGVGRARIASATSAFGSATSQGGVTPADEVNSGFRHSVNIGAGARWFAKPRLGVSFDLRVYVISAGKASETRPATPRATVTVGSVGISVR